MGGQSPGATPPASCRRRPIHESDGARTPQPGADSSQWAGFVPPFFKCFEQPSRSRRSKLIPGRPHLQTAHSLKLVAHARIHPFVRFLWESRPSPRRLWAEFPYCSSTYRERSETCVATEGVPGREATVRQLSIRSAVVAVLFIALLAGLVHHHNSEAESTACPCCHAGLERPVPLLADLLAAPPLKEVGSIDQVLSPRIQPVVCFATIGPRAPPSAQSRLSAESMTGVA